jgi:hypothetical protein
MANNDKQITINYDSTTKKYSYVPPQTDIDLDDSITFIVNHDCCICFNPVHVFGRKLRLRLGTHGPYAPSANTPTPIFITFCITDINSTCVPSRPSLETYSIKVG